MNYKTVLIQAGKEMEHRNLTISTWGNISVQDPKTKNIYITPSAMPYSSLKPSDIVVCNRQGKVIEGKRKPSVELMMHVKIYQARTDVHAILHTHPLNSTVFGVLHKSIPVVTDEVAQSIGGSIDVSTYALPGTIALANHVVKALGNKQACLIANHGAVCVGGSMSECFKVSTVLEASAAIYQQALAIGKVHTISDANCKKMRDFALYHYGQGK